LYPPKSATIIKGMNRKSKIKPISNLIGNVIQRTIVADDNKINIGLLNERNLFSKKIRKITTGKSKKRKFKSKVSTKVEHPFNC
jgi:hypothetical protein